MGYSPQYDLGEDIYKKYNDERYAYFSKINRVTGRNGAPKVSEIIMKHISRFYKDEALIDDVINDLQYEVDHIINNN